MTLDIRSEAFWELPKVEQELRRVYDICNGCRRCITLCPSFKDLFVSLDTEEVDGDAEKLAPGALKRVVDLCYQCKLCYNHCPYTPPHRWQGDFPRLMLRARAPEARRRGGRFPDRPLPHPAPGAPARENAVPGGGGGEGGSGAHPPERERAGGSGPGRARDRGAGADVQLHAQAGGSL